MKLFNRKQVITLAFNTDQKANRLTEEQRFSLMKKVSQVFGGGSLVENTGSYLMDNGEAAIEYSYTLTLIGTKKAAAQSFAQRLAKENGQESYLLNEKLVYTA
jgi:hypothetical protein